MCMLVCWWVVSYYVRYWISYGLVCKYYFMAGPVGQGCFTLGSCMLGLFELRFFIGVVCSMWFWTEFVC